MGVAIAERALNIVSQTEIEAASSSLEGVRPVHAPLADSLPDLLFESCPRGHEKPGICSDEEKRGGRLLQPTKPVNNQTLPTTNEPEEGARLKFDISLKAVGVGVVGG